ncbi:uncharacterized protein LOC124146009 isoform X2 [Haliotis rufescens]|uniref:uncharacterized protein LOC124146009 isoform X2 n=1 Tax=Haliotis rufescens TaxID=6454 RepID=UPI00201EF14D|nr:uncharacterized protein LOC124146009 isoform X2 [Haliotis rufescens]
MVSFKQTMSLSTVLKNVYTFAHILGQANGSEAGLWDVQSLNNALKWAAYCQKIHQQVSGQRVEEAVDKKLVEMLLLIDPPSRVCLSVDLMGQATSLLQQTLLQNPNTSVEVLTELKATDTPSHTMEELLRRLTEGRSTEDMEDMEDDIMRCIQEEKVQEKRKWTRERRRTPVPDSENPLITAQATFLVPHILKLSQQSSDLSRLLQRIPHFILVKAASADSSFREVYLRHLTSLANQMSPHYHDQLTNGRPYSWRCESERGKTNFHDLVTGFQSLLDIGGHTRETTAALLMERAQTSYFNIWRDICRKLS